MKMTADGYATLRSYLGSLSKDFVNGVEGMVSAFNADGKVTYPEASYMLATAYHETSGTMQPICERGSKTYFDKYDTGKLASNLGNTPNKDGDGYLWRGRGFVQLTGKDNYVKASKKLNIDFVDNPDLVLQLDNATKIMILGMREGWFTTHKLSYYINDGKVDFINARRIINGTDCAEKISKHASVFYNALRKP